MKRKITTIVIVCLILSLLVMPSSAIAKDTLFDDIDTGLSFYGVIKDANGEPIEGAKIITMALFPTVGPRITYTTTDSNGMYVTQKLERKRFAPGKYRVYVACPIVWNFEYYNYWHHDSMKKRLLFFSGTRIDYQFDILPWYEAPAW